VAPPAPKPTTILIGRVGKSEAAWTVETAGTLRTAHTETTESNRRIVDILQWLILFIGHRLQQRRRILQAYYRNGKHDLAIQKSGLFTY
jgi:hypothetical protein